MSRPAVVSDVTINIVDKRTNLDKNKRVAIFNFYGIDYV